MTNSPFYAPEFFEDPIFPHDPDTGLPTRMQIGQMQSFVNKNLGKVIGWTDLENGHCIVHALECNMDDLACMLESLNVDMSSVEVDYTEELQLFGGKGALAGNYCSSKI